MADAETRSTGSTGDTLIAAILQFLGGQDLLTLSDIRTALERELEAAGPSALLDLKTRLTTDYGWAYYPRDPLTQQIHHLLADRFLSPGSQLLGSSRLAEIPSEQVTVFANHLSYADANVIEVLLQRSGGAAIANRLTAMAGPKVFTSRERRFSSLCFGTIKVPQSADVASEEATLTQREVAKAARRSIEVAHDRLRAGDALLLFGEGTRSRTGAMQRMLPGVARYLEVPGTWVLPAGLSGSQELFPVGQTTIRPARVTLHLGCPLRADILVAHAGGDRRLIVDAIGLAVAELVSPACRGVYANADDFASAHAVLREARAGDSAGTAQPAH